MTGKSSPIWADLTLKGLVLSLNWKSLVPFVRSRWQTKPIVDHFLHMTGCRSAWDADTPCAKLVFQTSKEASALSIRLFADPKWKTNWKLHLRRFKNYIFSLADQDDHFNRQVAREYGPSATHRSSRFPSDPFVKIQIRPCDEWLRFLYGIFRKSKSNRNKVHPIFQKLTVIF